MIRLMMPTRMYNPAVAHNSVSSWSRRLFGVALLAGSAAACTRSPEETSENLGANTIAAWAHEAPPASMSGQVMRAVDARPSVDENMGRNFQGRMEFLVKVAGQPDRALRYLSRGNASRLQVDRKTDPVDVLFLDDHVYALDHSNKTYRLFELAKISGKPSDAISAVKIVHPTPLTPLTHKMIQGVACEDWTVTEGAITVEACVAALPGSFDVGKFEAVTGLNVPTWLQRLLAEDDLPVSLRAKDASGRELYSAVLEAYVPGPIDVENLSLPPGYKRS